MLRQLPAMIELASPDLLRASSNISYNRARNASAYFASYFMSPKPRIITETFKYVAMRDKYSDNEY